VIHTPVRAPQANAYAERFVRTVRAECLDWLLIVRRRHLEHVLRTYTAHYNAERPHRALALVPPEAVNRAARPANAKVERHDLLGGLIHEYRAAREPSFETPQDLTPFSNLIPEPAPRSLTVLETSTSLG
jgi:putative transposase